MRSLARLASAVGVLSLALVGCDGSTDSDGPTTETPEAAAGELPEIGTCWAVPEASVFDQQYWFDESSPVPCTEPHTTETTWVISLDEPTIAEAKEVAGRCWNITRRYVGIDDENWVPWAGTAFLPSKGELAAGASWVRCDVAFPETWAVPFLSGRTTTGSASGLAYDPPDDHWACLDEPPTSTEQPFVPCDQPHSYEETGTLAILAGLDRYPPAAERATEGRRQCREDVPAGYEEVSTTTVWDPPPVGETASIAGICFMFNADGQPLPAR